MSSKTKKSKPTLNGFCKFVHFEHKFVKKYGKHFKRDAHICHTWAETKRKARKGKTVGISCCYPSIIWYFRKHGIDNCCHAENGSFRKTFNKGIKKYLKRLTKGKWKGLTLKQAVDNGYLKKGDIICFKGCTHTVAYLGEEYFVYEGGSKVDKIGYSKVGLKIDYSKGYYKNKKINEILRWRKR